MSKPLSLQAQAVMEAAVRSEYGCDPKEVPNVAYNLMGPIAAALRAAANQLSYGHGSWAGTSAIIDEDKLLAIAAELEAGG